MDLGKRGLLALLSAALMSPAFGHAGEPPAHKDGGPAAAESGSAARQMMIGSMPAKYRALANPVAPTGQAVRRGADLYAALCAVCHGATGLGDGFGGEALGTSPATLVHTMGAPYASDPYLYWSIAEGGVELNTEMPAYADVLEPDEIWQVILYMRADFRCEVC